MLPKLEITTHGSQKRLNVSLYVKKVGAAIHLTPLNHFRSTICQPCNPHRLAIARHGAVTVFNRSVFGVDPSELKQAHPLCLSIKVELQHRHEAPQQG